MPPVVLVTSSFDAELGLAVPIAAMPPLGVICAIIALPPLPVFATLKAVTHPPLNPSIDIYLPETPPVVGLIKRLSVDDLNSVREVTIRFASTEKAFAGAVWLTDSCELEPIVNATAPTKKSENVEDVVFLNLITLPVLLYTENL